MQEQIKDILEHGSQVLAKCSEKLPNEIAAAVRVITASLRCGGMIAFCGNGGSAAQAQHFAAELVGRFLLERPAYQAIALTTDTSILTAVGNDYGFEEVFARQVEGLLKQNDVLVALSTSGNSENCLRAVRGKLNNLADHCITVPSYDTPQIQEAHLAIGHALCQVVEQALTQGED